MLSPLRRSDSRKHYINAISMGRYAHWHIDFDVRVMIWEYSSNHEYQYQYYSSNIDAAASRPATI